MPALQHPGQTANTDSDTAVNQIEHAPNEEADDSAAGLPNETDTNADMNPNGSRAGKRATRSSSSVANTTGGTTVAGGANAMQANIR